MEVEVRPADESEVRCTAQGARALCCAAATVPLFGVGMEALVLGQQQWEAVHDRRRRGHSISAIAGELGLDRKTVRSCLRKAAWRPYQRAAASSVLDPHREWLAARAPEVNYSARILWQELCAQRGFAGSYVIVRRAMAPLRLAATASSLTQCRFETGPGEQAQCDWGQVSVPLGGVRIAVHVFVMTLGYSRRGFAQGFLGERMHDLLAAHEAAFAHFGGRCEFLLYDRMRTVVLGTSEGRPRLNPTFASFDRANQVWAMDITYIPMARGFVYLAVVLDWFSRRVLAWRVSIDMAVDFCLDAVEEAIARHGTPDIFNTDSRGVVSALGQPVHQPGLHRPAGEQQHIDQHGRQGLMARQRLRRAAMALGQIRGGLPARLRQCRPGARLARSISGVLQARITTPIRLCC
jgi:transposase